MHRRIGRLASGLLLALALGCDDAQQAADGQIEVIGPTIVAMDQLRLHVRRVERFQEFDRLLRREALIGIDPDSGAIAIGEHVAPGDRVMFCRRDHDSAVSDMRRMLADLKKRAGASPIQGGLYFSCCARGPNQFGPDDAELKLISEELGDFPLVGFFANGEISNNRLYGYTGVLTLFL